MLIKVSTTEVKPVVNKFDIFKKYNLVSSHSLINHPSTALHIFLGICNSYLKGLQGNHFHSLKICKYISLIKNLHLRIFM